MDPNIAKETTTIVEVKNFSIFLWPLRRKTIMEMHSWGETNSPQIASALSLSRWSVWKQEGGGRGLFII